MTANGAVEDYAYEEIRHLQNDIHYYIGRRHSLTKSRSLLLDIEGAGSEKEQIALSKIAWYDKRIEELQAQLAAYNALEKL